MGNRFLGSIVPTAETVSRLGRQETQGESFTASAAHGDRVVTGKIRPLRVGCHGSAHDICQWSNRWLPAPPRTDDAKTPQIKPASAHWPIGMVCGGLPNLEESS
ncbi:hypothetical protein JOF29_004624 [Kribbella aluminosa]|uniref:Uncharacterized protein n=1 Tax=Kribbella aluminosa TaxID=416017 RepID=A0ABS4UPM8_9ACTN|nr:hypothetical protein [Kribbella aluminosa]